MTGGSQSDAPGVPDAPGGPGAPDAPGGPGAGLLELVDVMHRLRRECPWDAKQTHESLAPHLLEETYEALEALEDSDPEALREELGDVLLQVYFHAEIASERTDGSRYTIDDVARGIAAKLIRRHPHVFSDVRVSGADEVKQNWDAIKAAERQAKDGSPGSVLDGVPFGQPALALAAQLQRRAERAGAPPGLADLTDADRKPAQPAAGDQPAAKGQVGPEGEAQAQVTDIGAELFALVARARAAGLDPERELRAAARAYRHRVQSWEHSR
jgi:MazG family protein